MHLLVGTGMSYGISIAPDIFYSTDFFSLTIFQPAHYMPTFFIKQDRSEWSKHPSFKASLFL